MVATEEERKIRDRSRLIDHFKRVYTIVAGLAITEACRKLWPFSAASFFDYPFWMFATFFITIVPIFHGGDRSLDLKYIDHETKSALQRASYIWDVYMLLITAILFVGIAEAIPKLPTTHPDPARFYWFMLVLAWFDVFVLVVDYFKSDEQRKQKIKKSYRIWGPSNFTFGSVCWAAAYLVDLYGSDTANIFGWSLPWLSWAIFISMVVFIAAAGRTVIDYWRSDQFMFP